MIQQRSRTSPRWAKSGRYGDRYSVAVAYIRLADIMRTFERAGITPTYAHGEALSDLARVLDGR